MYKVKVNDSQQFEITEETVDGLDIIETSKDNYHILEKHKSTKATLVASDYNSKYYEVSVNNNTYKVKIQDTLDQRIDDMGFSLGALKRVNSIKAPMPGLILEINVKVGDEVKEDDGLLILEAMKMENVITSPRDGVIKTILVAKGDTVDKNKLLIEFE